jgi:predicted permease
MAARQREFSIRLALGATTADLVLQLLFESGAIVVAATVGALALSRAALPILQSVAGTSIPRADEATVDWRVAAFTVVVAAITSVSCWLVPALNMRRVEPHIGLRTAHWRNASRRPTWTGRRWLVATEVAIAVIVLGATGLLYRSVVRLGRLDLGFNPHGLLAVALALPENMAATRSRADVYEFYTRAVDEMATMPFVKSAAAVGQRPLKGPIGLDASWESEGQSPGAAKDNPWVNLEAVTPTYFEVIATPVLAGRRFDDRDRVTTEPVVIVNEKLARYAWPGRSAIGQRIRAGGLNLGRRPETWWTVVGVVPDIRYREIGATTLDLYVPFAQSWFPVGDLMIRTTTAPDTVVAAVRTRLRQIDPDGIIDIAPMDRVVEAHEAPWRTNLMLFGAFAVLTVLVAAVGLYAMLAATVVEQSREIGVRAALGATTARIIQDVLGQGIRTVFPGILAGLAASAASSGLIRSLLFEVSPLDRISLTGAASTLFAITVLACALAAMRAARVDPAVCLRAE